MAKNSRRTKRRTGRIAQ